MNKIFTNKHPELGLEINSLKQENNSTSSVEYYILYRPHFLIRRASEEDRKNNKYIQFVRDVENKDVTYEYEYEYVNNGTVALPKKFYSEKEVLSHFQREKNYLKKEQQSGKFELKYPNLTSTSNNYEYAKYAMNIFPKVLHLIICKECMKELPIILEVKNGTDVNEYTLTDFRRKYDEKMKSETKRRTQESKNRFIFHFDNYYSSNPYNTFVNRMLLEKLKYPNLNKLRPSEISNVIYEEFSFKNNSGISFTNYSFIDGYKNEAWLYYTVREGTNYDVPYNDPKRNISKEDNVNTLRKFWYDTYPTMFNGMYESKKYKDHYLIKLKF
jgi:hypothetical protein